MRLALKAKRVILVHKGLKAFLASVALLAQKVILAILAHRATKERRAIPDPKAYKAHRAHRVSKALLALKGLRAIRGIKVTPVHKVCKVLRVIPGHRAYKDLKAIPVLPVLKAKRVRRGNLESKAHRASVGHRGPLAKMAQVPQSPAQRQV